MIKAHELTKRIGAITAAALVLLHHVHGRTTRSTGRRSRYWEWLTDPCTGQPPLAHRRRVPVDHGRTISAPAIVQARSRTSGGTCDRRRAAAAPLDPRREGRRT